MLRSNVVLVHQVIPMIDHLNTELESIVNDEQKPKAVRHGAKNALRVLDNYYASISESEIYRVAMSEFMANHNIMPFAADYLIQFYIPDTKWHTFKPKGGPRNGLRLLLISHDGYGMKNTK